jgi:predicted Na+-dependent transporter
MSLILTSLYSAFGAAAILLFLSHLGPRLGKANFIMELEPPKIFGKDLKRREAHLIGVLIHFILYSIWGLLIGFALSAGWIPGLGPWVIIGVAIALTLIYSNIIMPLEGYGLFGKRHDRWFVLDSFLSQFVWAVLFALLMRLWGGV